MKWLIRIVMLFVVVAGMVLLVFSTPDTDPQEMRAKYGGAPSQFVMFDNGQKMHLRDEGPRDGFPIILLHGSSADLKTWQPWVEGLRDEYRVIRIDHIGHGLTGPAIGETYELSDFTLTVDQVAEHLKLERFVLAGSSMGGWISVGYALEHPDKVAGIALIGASGTPVKRPERATGNSGFSLASIPVLNQIMRFVTPRSLVEKSLRETVSNQDIVTDEAVDRYWEMLRYPGNRAATITRFATERRVYSAEEVSSLSMPTLLLWGVEDGLAPIEAGRWYDEHLPVSKLIEYQGIGHLPHEELAEESLSDLKEWLVQFGQETSSAEATGSETD